MRQLDADVINFLHEDDENAVTKIMRQAFEAPRSRHKIGPHDYLNNKGGIVNDYMNSTLFASDGPHDDTKVDLVKVMNRFQIDKELEEDY